MKKVVYIIPTLNRDSLFNSITSILTEDPYAKVVLKQGSTAGENRNAGILPEIIANTVVEDYSDWIVFLDDDDFLRKGYLLQLEDDYDIVVLKMLQNGIIIPRDNNLRGGNVGINFAIKTSFLTGIMTSGGTINTSYLFDSLGHAEDWRFLEKILQHNPKIRITEDVYYECSQVNHLL